VRLKSGLLDVNGACALLGFFEFVGLGCVLFQKEVIGGRQMIVLVVLHSGFDCLRAEAHGVLHFLDQLRVDGQLAGVVGEVLVLGLVELVEGVSAQTFNVDSLVRVSYENLGQNVLCVRREKLGQGVVGGENLLVEVARLLIFVGQVAAEHGVENYTERPDVRLEAVVLISSNHLRNSKIRFELTSGAA
jgi:hypothetical protein